MRTRERGIGNMAFIAVLVLLVIAIAMFFVSKSEADDYKARYNTERTKAANLNDVVLAAGKAYDKWNEISGFGIPEVSRTPDPAGLDKYPDPAVIDDKVRTVIMNAAGEIATQSQAKLKRGTWVIDSTTVKVTESGDETTVQLFNSGYVKETVTFASFIAPLGSQFAWAANAIKQNVDNANKEYAGNQTRHAALQQQLTQATSQFQADIASKAQAYDTEKTKASQMSDTVVADTAKIDALNAEITTLKTNYEKAQKISDRERSALQNALRNTKDQIEIAMKEDPEDGKVLVADARNGLAFLNRGKNFRVAPNMKFVIWRFGKGNIRENVAEVEVIESGDTKSTARVNKLFNPRVPVSADMSFSSPFYDPFKKLRVYIAGNLRYYPSDLAKRRLAESGCSVADRLDDTVNVVILGEPAVDLGADATSPEEAAANEDRAKAMREARIREIKDTSATLGAVVVTEEVLRTFIEY